MLRRELSWRGRTVRWDVLGDGPPVVFCHGTPWSSLLWEPLAHALAEAQGFSAFLWDMPGYGTSSMDPAHPVGLDVQGELLADLIGTWGLERPHLVAHDYGGAVALRAHLLGRVAYASLALVDVVALAPWGSDFFRLVREHAEVFGALPESVHAGALRAYVAGASHRGLTGAQLDALVAPWRDPVGQAAFYRQVAAADQRYTDEVEPLYPALDLPVLIAWGTEDTWIPVDRAHRLHELIPGSELVLVPEAGHLVQLDQPAYLASVLTGWLHRQAA